MAAAFLARHGATIEARNLRVGKGEIDLVMRHGGSVVAVEVKTIGFRAETEDPIDRIDRRKLRQVRRLAAEAQRSIHRVDFVGVRVGRTGVIVNWRTAVA